MKAAFKKLTLLSFREDRDKVTEMLQGLGVIHLELTADLTDKSIEELEQEKSRLNRVIKTIQDHKQKKKLTPQDTQAHQVEIVVNEVLRYAQQLDANAQRLELCQKDQLKLAPWGDFDANKIERLANHDITALFCISDKKSFKKEELKDVVYQVINEGPDQIYFVVFVKETLPEVQYETIELPSKGIGEIEAEKANIQELNREIISTIQSYEAHLPLLYDEVKRVENRLLFEQARRSFDEYGEGTILCIKGWFPFSMEGRIAHYLEKEKLVYSVEEPTVDDDIPVLLKNRKYPKLFESITNIFELPSYYELDPTPFIAVFYPILFAYCLGDAGYGLVLTLGATIGWFSFLKSARSMALLGITLGVFTTVMGVIKSGSVFGLPLSGTDSVPFFQFLARYVIIPDDRDYIFNAFNVALMIGVIQILLGIIISIYNKIKYETFLASLSQLGKFLIVLSLIWIFLADMQGMEALSPLLSIRRLLLFVGIGLVMLFHDLTQSIIKRPASAILPLFFIVTGILGDILSYVRLFALGVASSVLGLVVNQIGMQIFSNGWWGIAVGVIFLIFGHSLNFGIALLGAFVHPLRLTFVEFYNNAQFRGGGIAYRPFRKIELTDN